MGGRGRNKQVKKKGQSTSGNSCNGHSNLYKILKSRSACFSPSDVPGFRGRGLTLLHLAAREEDIALDIAQTILSCGCIPINSQILDDGRTPLYIASQYGQVNMVKLFLEQEGINVNIRDKHHMFTSLRVAVQNGHTEVVKLLLACEDIDVNLAGIDGSTPLQIAVIQNNETVVQILLTCATIEVNRKDSCGRTPLHYASSLGHVGVVRLLVEHKDIDLNLQTQCKDGMTAIFIAAEIGHVEVVKILLGCVGIDINKPVGFGSTPLNAAAREGHVEVVKILLGCVGIDINKSDSEGFTPLIIATYQNHVEVVKILLNSVGIDINKSEGSTGFTPLMLAIHKSHVEVVKILLGCVGIDIIINEPSSKGATPLMKAVQKGNIEVVKILLGCVGIDINKSNSTGYTPLMTGCNLWDIILTLYDREVDGNAIDKNGQTALNVNTQRTDIVKALVANKTININAETQSHDTALHLAAGSGNIEAVRILLDLYKKDKYIDFKKNLAGETALSLAQKRNYVEVVDVITKHMKKMERRKQQEIKYEAELQEAIAALDILD